ncbi:MAG: PspC domain-containing protein [Clostridiaceae bacterium]|jgi:phage shock protein C|nr:PspC domain-containing protein [Clostridiaceae bacterium]
MDKKLYLSDTNKVISGVCGGIGEYVGIDPTVVRLIWVILSFITAIIGGCLLYIAAMFIIPRK